MGFHHGLTKPPTDPLNPMIPDNALRLHKKGGYHGIDAPSVRALLFSLSLLTQYICAPVAFGGALLSSHRSITQQYSDGMIAPLELVSEMWVYFERYQNILAIQEASSFHEPIHKNQEGENGWMDTIKRAFERTDITIHNKTEIVKNAGELTLSFSQEVGENIMNGVKKVENIVSAPKEYMISSLLAFMSFRLLHHIFDMIRLGDGDRLKDRARKGLIRGLMGLFSSNKPIKIETLDA